MIYNSITLGDNQSINYLIVLKEEADSTDIELANNPDFQPAWSSFNNPQIFCPYEDNIVSSYITGLTSPLTGFVIYRQRIGEGRLYKVAEVDENTLSLVDYLISNNVEYQWIVMPLTENELGISMASQPMRANWEGISLSSLNEISKGVYIPNETWIFMEDIAYGGMNPNIDRTVHKTYSKYPKVAVGASNYLSGDISCRLSKIHCPSGVYDSSTELYNKWREFVASGKPFLYKDMKGQMFMAQITDTTAQYLDGYIENMNDNVPQYHHISFSYIEVGGTDDVTIYEPISEEN